MERVYHYWLKLWQYSWYHNSFYSFLSPQFVNGLRLGWRNHRITKAQIINQAEVSIGRLLLLLKLLSQGIGCRDICYPPARSHYHRFSRSFLDLGAVWWLFVAHVVFVVQKDTFHIGSHGRKTNTKGVFQKKKTAWATNSCHRKHHKIQAFFIFRWDLPGG